MTTVRFVTVSLVLIVLALTGCETEPVAPPGPGPTISVLGVRVTDPKLDYATLTFEVEIENPNPSPLSLQTYRYSLASGGRTFLSQASAKGVAVPANSTRIVNLSDRVFYDRLLRGLGAKSGTVVPYSVGIWLRADAATARPLGYEGRQTGQLELPEAATVEIEGKAYHTVDVVFVATPADVVDRMLKVARVTKDDVLVDLGCGDGRIPVAAAKLYQCRAFGYDIDPERIREALQIARENGVDGLVTVQQKDIYTVDLSDISVVALYLLPTMNAKLIPQFRQLKPGSRIVAHNFPIPGIKPDKIVTMTSQQDNEEHVVYLWTAPLKEPAVLPGVE